MRPRVIGLYTLAAALILSAVVLGQTPMDTAFTYQGLLKQSGSPVTDLCDFQFALYNAVSGVGQIGATQTKSTVTVRNGLFAVTLDFGPAFQGDKNWLDIQARCPSSGSYVALSPRQQMTATPYALGLPGLHTEMNAESPNIIGGRIGNFLTPGVVGAVIGGGGSPTLSCGTSGTAPCPNRVTDNYGVVGGGLGNQAGNNAFTTADSELATVGGGGDNTASGDGATVGGGLRNTASGPYATVGGGHRNSASLSADTVGGGIGNTASGNYATVGGGLYNTASKFLATVPGGTEAVASHYGEMAYASGTFIPTSGSPVYGQAQASLYVLRNTTSDSTKTYLYLDGGLQPYRIFLTAGHAMVFEIQVIGTSDLGVTAGYRIRGVLKNVCGSTTMVGATGDVLGVDASALLWNAGAEADDINDALAIWVNGSTGVNVRWVASVRTTEVAWPSSGCILP
jgi:hypothetical protein